MRDSAYGYAAAFACHVMSFQGGIRWKQLQSIAIPKFHVTFVWTLTRSLLKLPNARMQCIHQRCICMRWNHEQEIMDRTLGAGPSVGHPFLCETTTLRTVPVANSSERTRTWSSCVAHSTKAARIVPGGSLNTISAHMEEFIGPLSWTPHGRGTGQVAGLSVRKGAGPY